MPQCLPCNMRYRTSLYVVHSKDALNFGEAHRRLLEVLEKGTYYDLFGVTANASRAEIQQSFQQLARKFHPDRHMGQSERVGLLQDLMGLVTTAYKTLGMTRNAPTTTSTLRPRAPSHSVKARPKTKKAWTNASPGPNSVCGRTIRKDPFCGSASVWRSPRQWSNTTYFLRAA
jgi:hypothetical protein